MDTVQQIASEESYKDLFDSALDLIHIVHLDGRIMYANPSWTNLLEYELSEIIGRSVYSLIDPADREQFIEYRKRVIGGSMEKEAIFTVNTKSGKKIVLEGKVTVKHKNGEAVYTRGIFRDITERLRQEEELKRYTDELTQREVNLQQLLMHAPDAVVVINEASEITFWNSKAEDMFGWKSEEVMGASLGEKIIPPQFRAAHDAGMKRFFSTGESRVLNKTIEISALKKDRQEFFVSLTISQTRQKNKIAFIAFIRDISEQKKNQQQLEQKTRELETSNQKLEQFAHVASHDMKEPIRKVKLFNELVKDNYGHLLPPSANVYLEKVQRAADRLLNMVEGVLKYSMIEKNTEPTAWIDLNNVLANVQADLELVIKEKKATITYDDLPNVEGVPFLIYQLFYNLINNSLKFVRVDNDPVIQVTGRRTNNDKGELIVEVMVKDNGIGFRQDDAIKIFETFTRLHSKDQFHGTGLGLALCKDVVERHGGTIRAEGTPNQGATFIIQLPERTQKKNP